MRKALRIFPALSALAVLSFVAGCGGDGGGNDPIEDSVFAGTYRSGTFTATGDAQGTATGIVSNRGDLDANLVLTSEENETGTLNGTIQQNGSFSGTLDSPSLPDSVGAVSITGNFEQIEGGIQGTFSRTINGQEFSATLTLYEAELN